MQGKGAGTIPPTGRDNLDKRVMMAKKETSDDTRGRLMVVDAQGERQRFLRGMITHDLVQRGLGFDDAYAAARAVRDRLSERVEVETSEIRALLEAHLEAAFGGAVPIDLSAERSPVADLSVIRDGQSEPYSRGLLARSVHAAGLDFDRAYRLAGELEASLRAEKIQVLDSDEVTRRVAELMRRSEGAEMARRYRFVRQVDRLPRPLVIYVGGASGTGKSTLSLELAPLLRIYRINATDTIRQVMRMVFSPQMLPALHNSSFEPLPELGEEGRSDLEPERVMASFTEQAIRVNVGVRATVERALAENMNILVEGVHLYPPLVPFVDLEGAAYQVPLMLGIFDRELHRARFVQRGRQGRRQTDRYLGGFPAIRSVHEFLLQQAEDHDVPLLETSGRTTPVPMALGVVTTLLRRKLPALGASAWPSGEAPSAVLVIIDGFADRPVRALGGRTPLAAAHTPTLDRLAREGRTGLADPVGPGVVPDTAAGSLALFGQAPSAIKRGPVEALGAGFRLRASDVALRGNFATVDSRGTILDRRAGRIRDHAEQLAEALDRLPLPGNLPGDIEVRVKAATEHRLAIVLRGHDLSSRFRGSDPGDGAAPGPALTPEPIDPADERAVFTAGVLALFEQEARRRLARHPINRERRRSGLPAANAILTRGPGRVHRLVPLEESGLPLRLTCVGGDRTVLGLASWLGARIQTSPAMTANLDTDLDAKFDAARAAMDHSDLVVVHLKGADIAAHDRRPDLKVAFLERVDRSLARFLKRAKPPLRIAVAGDHATLSESGQHAADPLPVLIWGHQVEADGVTTFDESSAAAGSLQRFPLQLLIVRLFERPAAPVSDE